MGFRLSVNGMNGKIELDEKTIQTVGFYSQSAKDSNARATDFGLAAKVTGKMLFKLDGSGEDGTLGLSQWSQVASEQADCYRSVEIEVVSAGQTVRKYVMPNAFVMEYEEHLDDETGVGAFYLHIKQKKDENAAVKVEGGYSSEE